MRWRSRNFMATKQPFSTPPNRHFGFGNCHVSDESGSAGFETEPLYFFKTLNLLALHGGRDVVRLPDGERNDGQRRVAGRAAGELAAVGHEQVLDVVGLAELVHHAIPRLLAH